MNEATRITQIVSGGQTGVDRAALDTAISLGIPHGGWCPKGRLAEDGEIPKDYRLRETESRHYAVRTEQNVIDADGTLILFVESMSGGTDLTWRLAKKHRRARLAIDLDSDDLPAACELVRQWLRDQNISVINIAGPRESTVPGIGRRSESFLSLLLSPA